MRPGFLAPERVPFVDVQVIPAAPADRGPVVDVQLQPAPTTSAGAPAGHDRVKDERQSCPDPTGVLMFERLVCDPNASVEKCERMMALWERSEARRSATLFHAAMRAAQEEMRPIAADMDNPQTKSRYASYAKLDRALRPIYTKHGFALSFNTGEAQAPDEVRVLCDVTHLGGHLKQYKADLPADGKGAKGGDVMTRTHATGSAMSYGMRYLLKMIFNVAVGEADDDGNRATAPRDTRRPAAPTQHPSGYLRWLATLRAAAPHGLAALERVWYDAPKAFRQHLDATNLALRADLKAIAARVTPAAKAS